MGPLCIRGDGLDREYGTQIILGPPGGLGPGVKAMSAPRRRRLIERQSFQKSLNRSGASAV